MNNKQYPFTSELIDYIVTEKIKLKNNNANNEFINRITDYLIH